MHLGQIKPIGADDKDYLAYSDFIAKVRHYAKIHTRRRYVLPDGHVLKGGMIQNGIIHLVYNSFPLRIKEIPSKPNQTELRANWLDAIYNRST